MSKRAGARCASFWKCLSRTRLSLICESALSSFLPNVLCLRSHFIIFNRIGWYSRSFLSPFPVALEYPILKLRANLSVQKRHQGYPGLNQRNAILRQLPLANLLLSGRGSGMVSIPSPPFLAEFHGNVFVLLTGTPLARPRCV